MTTALIEPATAPPAASTETLGDLLKRLGDISPDRVRFHPPLGTATVADVVAIEAKEHRLFELVEGVLVEKGMGYRESYLAGLILTLLNNWVLPRKLGMVTGADGMMRLFPALVRIPDVAFASWARFPGGKVPDDPVPQLVPDLAVEVLSDSNTEREMNRKRGEYFEAGVKLAWFVDPKTHTVAVYTAPEQFVVLGEEQVLEGEAVLPGFTLSLRELFAEIKK